MVELEVEAPTTDLKKTMFEISQRKTVQMFVLGNSYQFWLFFLK